VEEYTWGLALRSFFSFGLAAGSATLEPQVPSLSQFVQRLLSFQTIILSDDGSVEVLSSTASTVQTVSMALQFIIVLDP
jgi:hypothetical protein